MADRYFDLENALANQRLEGLEVDAETVCDLKSCARGEMKLVTARSRALARIALQVRRLSALAQ